MTCLIPCIHQFYADTEYSLEDLPGAMFNKDGSRRRVRTPSYWHNLLIIYIYIYTQKNTHRYIMHTYIHIYIYIYTYTHKQQCTLTHTCTHTHIYVYKHTHKDMHTGTYTNTNTHTYTHIYAHKKHALTHMQTYITGWFPVVFFVAYQSLKNFLKSLL